MRSTFKAITARFSRDEKGATLVEYGIAVVLAVVVGTGGLIFMANQVDANMGSAQDAMVPQTVGADGTSAAAAGFTDVGQ